jgi:hypothetical protein
MKKIVGIIAALAMAGAVFAVDVASMIHGWTDLLSMDLAADNAKPAFLGVRDPFDRQYAWYSTGIKFSVAADKCGGSFEVNHRDAEVMSVNAYVQPTDAVKIAVGKIGLATNAETIDYTKLRAFDDGKEGWAIDLTPVDGLTINTMLVTGAARGWGWAFWGQNGKIGETGIKIGYSADFGSVFALVDYADPVTDISAGYSGNFGGIGIFADFAYTMKENANELGVDLFVDGHADAFGYKVYVKFARGLDTEVNQLCAKFRGSFALDFGNAYLRVVTVNALADEFPIQVQPGLEFNIGAASLDVGFQFDMNSDFDSTNFGNYAAGAKQIHMPLIYRVVF